MRIAINHSEELETIIKLSARVKQLEADIRQKGGENVSVQDKRSNQSQDADPK